MSDLMPEGLVRPVLGCGLGLLLAALAAVLLVTFAAGYMAGR